jgi:hypothetical protein
MDLELKKIILSFLTENRSIAFKVVFHHKGTTVDISIGDLENEQCGEIYSLLEEWFSEGKFLDSLMEKYDITYDFEGYFTLDEGEIVLNISFFGPLDDECDDLYISFDEDFIADELNIDLDEYSSLIPDFDFEMISVSFTFETGGSIENLEFYYSDTHPVEIPLNEIQLSKLKEFITDYMDENLPTLSIDIPCNQLYDVECTDNQINVRVYTSFIKMRWDDIYASD